MAGIEPHAGNVGATVGVIPLVARTVKLFGEPTAIRLEPSYWEALDEICRREDLTVDELCSDLKERMDQQTKRSRRVSGVSLSNAVRVFIVGYYRKAATEKGHDRAGHGRGDPFVSTPFDLPASLERP
ncbi:ribbon-helix-helix domain-containing protein [Azospirillum sp. sgz302134]